MKLKEGKEILKKVFEEDLEDFLVKDGFFKVEWDRAGLYNENDECIQIAKKQVEYIVELYGDNDEFVKEMLRNIIFKLYSKITRINPLKEEGGCEYEGSYLRQLQYIIKYYNEKFLK